MNGFPFSDRRDSDRGCQGEVFNRAERHNISGEHLGAVGDS